MAVDYSTTTQQTGPQPWQVPYYQQGLQYSQNLLNAGAPQYYPGSTVTPFSSATEQAMAGIQQRATEGSPLVNQAQSYVSNQLSTPVQSSFGQAQNPYANAANPFAYNGNGYLAGMATPAGLTNGMNPFATSANPFGGASNPYLDAMFQRAAQSSRGALESEFARAGRNVNAAAPIRGEQLNNLATSLYGGAYDAERNRQYGYAGQQLGIGAQGFENAQQRAMQDLLSRREITDAERSREAQYQSQLTGIGAQGYENAQQRALADLQSQRSTNISALSQVPSLANQQYLDYQQLANVGSQMEDLTSRYQQDAMNRWNYEQAAPGVALDDYLRRIGMIDGGQTSTTSTPYYSSTTGNVLGGALAGASLGSGYGQYGGLYGALLGGLAGAL